MNAELPDHLAGRVASHNETKGRNRGEHAADHDLLFEALAIHLGFVTRSAVDEARKIVALDDAERDLGRRRSCPIELA